MISAHWRHRAVQWPSAVRIVPSRYPPINTFGRIAPDTQAEALARLEGLTNARLREERGETTLVPMPDRALGPGASVIMAPFTHIRANHFNTEDFGALYAADTALTAIDESCHGWEQMLRETAAPPTHLEMRAYHLSVRGRFVDLAGGAQRWPDLYDPASYTASQSASRLWHEDQEEGVYYESVRHPGGLCVAVYRPRLLTHCRQGTHYCYQWDGRHITSWAELHLRN